MGRESLSPELSKFHIFGLFLDRLLLGAALGLAVDSGGTEITWSRSSMASFLASHALYEATRSAFLPSSSLEAAAAAAALAEERVMLVQLLLGWIGSFPPDVLLFVQIVSGCLFQYQARIVLLIHAITVCYTNVGNDKMCSDIGDLVMYNLVRGRLVDL